MLRVPYKKCKVNIFKNLYVDYPIIFLITIIGKVSAHMEDLKAQLNEKQVVERKLSEENRQLYNSMEREVNAIKIGGVN